jgi:hypothetical protein
MVDGEVLMPYKLPPEPTRIKKVNTEEQIKV